ncbi:putative cytokinetic ring protein SteA [Paenibacillus thalictri]|uniref:Thiamine pyrophosphokinase n=1 Tax=Paenibacillus thalictri TaxID=2527873 RepID=A0A4Q9DSK6_9BACL|nr:putative cytokinetic ring protein SteA [Paenibacillus thalictri]TBL79839.1 thiamine pyrophosphokinase [Paenibacillus thalictri]
MEYSEVITENRAWIEGPVKMGRKTKQLLKTAEPGCIVVIDHEDVDELAAEELIRAKVKIIINAGKTMSGRIMTKGPLLLLDKAVPIIEINRLWYTFFQDGMTIRIDESGIWTDQVRIPYTRFTMASWDQLYRQAHRCFHVELGKFIDNTLQHALQESRMVVQPLHCPKLRTQVEGRHVLVVTRGSKYREDLAAVRAYIKAYKPVLLGVDGGADALLELGYTPDLIVGDMDSVSDRALGSGAELVVQSYVEGAAPGLERIRRLGLTANVLPCMGTSEDAALLMAYELKASLIIAIGSHNHMNEYLEKGRNGMGSSMLVRMKIGDKLIDAKGFSMLLSAQKTRSWLRNGAAGLALLSGFLAAQLLGKWMFPAALPGWSVLKGWLH